MRIVKELLKHKFPAILLIILVVSNFLWLFVNISRAKTEKNKAEQYSLLSRRLFVENQNDIIVNLAPLRAEIKKYLQDIGIPHSFYLEYLPSGTSIRVGDSEELVGASLMKVPVIMDLYKSYELGKLHPDQKVTIDSQAISQKFGLLWQAGVGTPITLRETTKLAFSDSDNTAARLILEQTQNVLDPRERSLNFLDVEQQQSQDAEQQIILISARAYSSFFKCLYLSCYLSYDNSQEILKLLTETNFHSRLEAGIPDKSVKVAHKIGSYSEKSSSDCGIIYVPKRPYVICLMLNSTEDGIDKHFAEVSKMAYDYITHINPSN